MSLPEMETIKVSYPTEEIAVVALNRPKQLNAVNDTMFKEIKIVFDFLSLSQAIRCIILTGTEKSFTAGIDLTGFRPLRGEDPARSALALEIHLRQMQDSVSSIELCRKPVIAVLSGYCIGLGIDIITACCIRICSRSSLFSVRETIVGLTADMGTLQRLPRIVGNESWVKTLVYTGRNFRADEALKHGLVSEVYENYEKVFEAGLDLAKDIAQKSPLVMVGNKRTINYSRDHTVKEGLDFVIGWASVGLQSQDLETAGMAVLQKKVPVFPKL